MTTKELEVKVLGTISPYVEGNRNGPGFLVSYDGINIILDCGEGVMRNIDYDKDIQNAYVFISHFDPDHYVGLFGLGAKKYVLKNVIGADKLINVYLPKKDDGYEDNSIDPYSREFKRMLEERNYFSNVNWYGRKDVYVFGDMRVTFMENKHSILTYSTKIEIGNKKIVYTSDMGPESIENLIWFAKDADLLIGEASLVRSQRVVNQNHLHAYEMAEAAKKAGSKKLMLTHFWPETPVEEYLNEAISVFPNTEVAREGKVLKLGGIYE